MPNPKANNGDTHTNAYSPETPMPLWQKLGHKLKLGLRSRAEADWLPYQDLFGREHLRNQQIALKANLSEQRHAEVFAALEGSEASGAETLEMVQNHLSAYHHQPPPSKNAISTHSDLHPLDAAARIIPEDLLLLAPSTGRDGVGDEQRWHLIAGALAFPAHWVLAEKMGKPLAAIHEPVPHYAERLEIAMDRFFNNMKIGPISSRMNWSLQSGENYFAPHRMNRGTLDAANVPNELFLRVENQTLRKLPRTGHILFTIRTHMVAFDAWQHDVKAIKNLLDMMQEMSPAARDYKGIHLYEAPLRKWLATLISK